MVDRGASEISLHGIEEIVLSVFDIERAAAPLIRLGGYRPVELPCLAPEQIALWSGREDSPPATQLLLLPPTGSRGALRIVCFDCPRELIRPSQRSWDTGGIFDVDIFSQ